MIFTQATVSLLLTTWRMTHMRRGNHPQHQRRQPRGIRDVLYQASLDVTELVRDTDGSRKELERIGALESYSEWRKLTMTRRKASKVQADLEELSLDVDSENIEEATLDSGTFSAPPENA